MDSMTWHDGPPPSMGWWPASTLKVGGCYRWWNGEWWSVTAYSGDCAEAAGSCAGVQTMCEGVQWQHRPSDWPERSMT